MAEQPKPGEFIRAHRHLLGLTQEAFAEQIGSTAETIKRLEAGSRRPSPKLAVALAQAFQLEPELQKAFVAWVRGEMLPQWRLDQLLASLPTSDRPTGREALPNTQPHAMWSQALRDRQRMIAKMRAIWITGLLDRSLAGRAPIALRRIEQPDAVEQPVIFQNQELRMVRELDPAQSIGTIFDDKGGELLLLGAPGAGKTSQLLRLADALLERAIRDEAHPIPVIFNLSSWAERRPPVANWLVQELNLIYGVPVRTAKHWVAADQILPLLDGLDEVPRSYRAACVAAINVFRGEHGLVPIAVCSRVDEYQALGDVRLKLQGAVRIEPLTPEQIDAYLAQGSSQLDVLRREFLINADVRAFAGVPLFLSMLIALYAHNETASVLTTGTEQQRRQVLFDSYVNHMTARRSANLPYTRESALAWLGWLAQSMTYHSRSLFFIEHLSPDWLPSPVSQERYAAAEKLAFGFVAGSVSAFVWSLGGGLNGRSIASPATAWLLNEPTAFLVPQVRAWLIAACGITLLLGVSVALLVWMASRIVERFISAFGAPVDLQRCHLATAAAIGLSVGLVDGLLVGWRNGIGAGSLLANFALGLLTAVAAGLGAAFVYWRASRPGQIVIIETFSWSWEGWRWVAWGCGIGLVLGALYGLTEWAAAASFQALGYGLVLGLGNGLVGGLLAGTMVGVGRGKLPESSSSNEGIYRSARTAFWMGLLVWLGVGLAAALSDAFALKATYWSGFTMPLEVLRHIIVWNGINWLLWALSFGVGAAMLQGGLACIQHGIVRGLLWRNGAMPWNYARFLDFAAERQLLRKVGGGYQFHHNLLQVHFTARPAYGERNAKHSSSADNREESGEEGA